MSKILSLLSFVGTKLPATWMILAGIAAALSGAIGVQTWRLHSAQVQVAKAQALTAEKNAALQVCTVDLKTVGDQIALQNSHVTELEALSAAQATALTLAEAKATKAQADVSAAVDAISKSAPTPQAPAAIDWLADQGAELAKGFGSKK
jgi:hypothetical protein